MAGNDTIKLLLLSLAALLALSVALLVPAEVRAQSSDQPRSAERYVPSSWVDPDGCEHWVMDDGAEGYMSPHLTRDGRPVCRRGKVCGIMPTDQYFDTDKWQISGTGQQRLRDFFARATAPSGFIITGHTDSRASDEYNMRLSERRANSVALVAKATGVRVLDVRGYGERQPRASNDTARGRAENRRVEIICLQ